MDIEDEYEYKYSRRVEEYLANAGVPPIGNKDHPQEGQSPKGNQAPIIAQPMTDGYIRVDIATLSQDTTTKSQEIASQAKAMTAPANRGVGPRAQQNFNTIASFLRDIKRMNTEMFLGVKVNEDHQDFLNEIYKILYSMGLTLNEKVRLPSHQQKDVAQT